jgi:hypothetical protein
VVRIALSDAAAEGLSRHVGALASVRAVAQRSGFDTTRLPEVVATGTCLGQHYAIETARPGYRANRMSPDVIGAAAEAYAWCHGLDRRECTIDDDLLTVLVGEPIMVLAGDERMQRDLAALSELHLHLYANLRGREVVVSRTHGDAWLGNLLFDRSSFSPHVTAILDWEDSQACGLGDVDLIHLWMSTQPDGFAQVTETYAAASAQQLVGGLARLPNPTLPAGPTAMLAWLAHTSSGVRRATESGLSARWFDRNLHQVLDRWASSGVADLVFVAPPADRHRRETAPTTGLR